MKVALRDGAERELTRAVRFGGRWALRNEHAGGLKRDFMPLTYDAGTEPQKVFSVNPSPKESQLTYVKSPATVKGWQVNIEPQKNKLIAANPKARLTAASIWQQQFWWWHGDGRSAGVGGGNTRSRERYGGNADDCGE